MNQLSRPTILIVEDEYLIRASAAISFEDEGFIVFEAEHAAAALIMHAANVEIQVIFTDINMPGDMTGIDMAERLKLSAPGLHFIITSALPLMRSIDHLAATFFAKPYDARAVCQRARSMLAA